MKKKNTARLRFIIMIAVLAVVAVGYFTSVGIGNSCGIGFGSITLLCPLGSILAMIAQRTAIPMAIISVVAVLVICIVLGKVFCSWVCPVHFLSKLKPTRKAKTVKTNGAEAGEGVGAVDASGECASNAVATGEGAAAKSLCASCATCASPCGKSKGIKIDSRHGILAAALLSTGIFGFPVFCIICPVGLTFISVMLIMRLFAFGEATWTIVAFIAIIVVEVILLPRWCSKFCPLGALLSLFSGLNKTFRPTVDESKCLNRQGIECNRCVHSCPEGINLHDIATGATTINDCSKCKICSDVCPAGAISFPLLPHANKGDGTRATETADVNIAAGVGACAGENAGEGAR
jgi:ferredoxin-type protein NapH